MSELLRLSKPVFLTIVLALFGHSQALCQKVYRSLDDDRTNDIFHGLYEVNQEAVIFLNRENIKNGTNWQSLDPNLKTKVPRCLVPLKVEWAGKHLGFSQKTVLVICTKSVSNYTPNWDVSIPVHNSSKNK